jgi:hypothetical protein
MRPTAPLPVDVETHRDYHWRRDATRQVETAFDAERFIEQVGFSACLTDTRRSGPSLYVAVCGRRDAVLPRHVQKDPETSLTWRVKDDILRRGRIYYAKLSRGRSAFIAPRLVAQFHAVWGMPRSQEKKRLSEPARCILRVLRREWEMTSAELRHDARIADRRVFSGAMDELQAAMIVVPGAVFYEPKFTYTWTLAAGRFPDALTRRVKQPDALREIARAFLAGAGLTVRGELARVAGLSRKDAGIGNHALVEEGYARRLATGVYRLAGPLTTFGE